MLETIVKLNSFYFIADWYFSFFYRHQIENYFSRKDYLKENYSTIKWGKDAVLSLYPFSATLGDSILLIFIRSNNWNWYFYNFIVTTFTFFC